MNMAEGIRKFILRAGDQLTPDNVACQQEFESLCEAGLPLAVVGEDYSNWCTQIERLRAAAERPKTLYSDAIDPSVRHGCL